MAGKSIHLDILQSHDTPPICHRIQTEFARLPNSPPRKNHSQHPPRKDTMADEGLNIYDEIEIEDMTFDPAMQIYTFPCPCGDRFEICIDDLRDGEEIAVCPSCSLMIRVIFDLVCFGR